MGIQYFYNFSLTEFDDIDLKSDILSAVRKSYFASFEKIRDRITYDSEGTPLLYDYSIERGKPLHWTVKSPDGKVRQEVLSADDGRYYLCFYQEDKLFKRLLFSKLHTLLKAEYMDENGAVCRSLEPRKVQGGLCLLYTDNGLEKPLVLNAAPEINDENVADRFYHEFSDYTAAAATNEGVILFLSEEQTASFRQLAEQIREELNQKDDLSFVGDEAPLFEKINAKDFNIKRNLSASLDIAEAKNFGETASDEDEPEEELVDAEQVIPVEIDEEQTSADITENETEEAAETAAEQPDKLIMADGAVYSYYGELDDNGNRSGYGRTLTEIGRTAYVGMYLNDKRSGKGAYFYKDGTLCYSGDWSENVRHGVGVGISARDGSMHIGRWVNNKPEGNGMRMTADGEIKFVCKELSDGTTVLTNFLDDDTVLISKYDQDGAKLSEKKISLNEI